MLSLVIWRCLISFEDSGVFLIPANPPEVSSHCQLPIIFGGLELVPWLLAQPIISGIRYSIRNFFIGSIYCFSFRNDKKMVFVLSILYDCIVWRTYQKLSFRHGIPRHSLLSEIRAKRKSPLNEQWGLLFNNDILFKPS